MTRFQRAQIYVCRIKRDRLHAFKVWYWATVAQTGEHVRVTTIEYAGSWKAVVRWHRQPNPRFSKKGRIHLRKP